MKAFGSPNRAARDPFGKDARWPPARLSTCAALPEYDIANARYAALLHRRFRRDVALPGALPESFGTAAGGPGDERGKFLHFGRACR
jgi:hypothetical protein